MNAIITVFKSESGARGLHRGLSKISKEVMELSDAFIYNPEPGRLLEFLSLLKENKIAYGTHFDTMDQFITKSDTRITFLG
jgi:hypothetical protein